MSNASTIYFIGKYREQATKPMFLSSLFTTKTYHHSQMVEIDIIRDNREIAPVLTELSAGPNYNEATKYVNKAFLPPAFDEATTVDAFDMFKRAPGHHGFEDAGGADARMGMALWDHLVDTGGLLETKVRRVIELMAGQVLTSGVVTLPNNAGVPAYTLDYQPDPTHFPTAAIDWGTGTEDKLGDLAGLADVLLRDGHARPDQLIFGRTSLREFFADAAVQALYDNRRIDAGEIKLEQRPDGAAYHGTLDIGGYSFEIWSYDGEYTEPGSSTVKPYIPTDVVIMRAKSGRLDLAYGAIPRLLPPDPRLAGLLPARMPMPDIGLDLTPNIWPAPNGQVVHLSLGTRPLTIPTAINTIGALNTVA